MDAIIATIHVPCSFADDVLALGTALPAKASFPDNN
jgi:hypothetical protein